MPEPKRGIYVRVSEEVHDSLLRLAFQDRRSLSAEAALILERAVRKISETQPPATVSNGLSQPPRLFDRQPVPKPGGN